MHLIFHSCLGVFSVQTIYECVERLPSEPSVPKLYFMCVMCMPCSAVVNVCIWVGVSSLFCPHIFADRQTAQCNAAVFDRLINTGSGRRQQTQFVFRAETFKPPFPVTTLRGIMSFLQHSPAVCIHWYVIRVLYQVSICQKHFHESVYMIYVNIWRSAAGCCVIMCYCIKVNHTNTGTCGSNNCLVMIVHTSSYTMPCQKWS